MTQELFGIMRKYKPICFLKAYETTFQGQLQRRNAIIKAYTIDEVHNIPLALPDPPITFQTSNLLLHPSAHESQRPIPKY